MEDGMDALFEVKVDYPRQVSRPYPFLLLKLIHVAIKGLLSSHNLLFYLMVAFRIQNMIDDGFSKGVFQSIAFLDSI